MVLASQLAERGDPEGAARELNEIKAQVLALDDPEMSQRFLQMLGELLSQSDSEAAAHDVWAELLQIADRAGNSSSAIRALGNIGASYASELRAVRERKTEGAEGRGPTEADEGQSLVPDGVPQTVETEDDAIALVHALMEAGRTSAETPVPDWVEVVKRDTGVDVTESPTFRMAQIVQARASEFNTVFFQCVALNVDHGALDGRLDTRALSWRWRDSSWAFWRSRSSSAEPFFRRSRKKTKP